MPNTRFPVPGEGCLRWKMFMGLLLRKIWSLVVLTVGEGILKNALILLLLLLFFAFPQGTFLKVMAHCVVDGEKERKTHETDNPKVMTEEERVQQEITVVFLLRPLRVGWQAATARLHSCGWSRFVCQDGSGWGEIFWF